MKDTFNEYTYEIINALALFPRKFLKECSEEYAEKVKRAAKRIFDAPSKKIVMLAGPSASGKTTTASLLSSDIEALGGKAYTVSLDDFYLPRNVEYPLDENGNPDYECVEALDTKLIRAAFEELICGGGTNLPRFDFNSGERIRDDRRIELRRNDVVIVEGLHALNPVIIDALGEANVFKIYIGVFSKVYGKDGSVLLSRRELRFIRRMTRDYGFRSMPVERTFEIWESVARGENKYLFPYEDTADEKINSFHPCEPCALAPKAVGLLGGVRSGKFAERASALKSKLELFRYVDYSILPPNSLLREFTG